MTDDELLAHFIGMCQRALQAHPGGWVLTDLDILRELNWSGAGTEITNFLQQKVREGINFPFQVQCGWGGYIWNLAPLGAGFQSAKLLRPELNLPF